LFSGTTKLNGSAIPPALKNRPRIPTPDVTRELEVTGKLALPSAPPASPTPPPDLPGDVASPSTHHSSHQHHPQQQRSFTPTEIPAVVQVIRIIN
jgi:hypothetical protein